MPEPAGRSEKPTNGSKAPTAAFITGTAAFLPNAPVDNETLERVLGLVGGAPSRARSRVLRSNGIRTRHYAIDPETGRQTHSNAQLTAEAVRQLAMRSVLRLEEIDCLTCGTSSPDQWIPNHALMVHGELGSPPCEVVSTAGVCVSGMTALKYAALSVAAGSASVAVATGSELSSSVLRASHFQTEIDERAAALEKPPIVAFEQEFLRWMLSDGAGALLLTPAPRAGGPALRIEWIEIVSYAGELPSCMYWGAQRHEDGTLSGWREFEDFREALTRGVFNVSQDVRLLKKEVSYRAVHCGFDRVRRKRRLAPGDVDWFLPHYSSEYFRQELHDRFVEIDFPIPFEKWFSNLPTRGNTGSASIYIILEELISSGRLRPGERLLCLIPESARFSMAYMLLTVEVS